jgi:hypothetical protein
VTRASRKDRKEQRQRAVNAADRGLPTATIEPRKHGGPLGSAGDSPDASDATHGASGRPTSKGWFASWPASVKLLGLATLALLGIGLWRTLNAAPHDASPADATVAPSETVPQTGNPSR